MALDIPADDMARQLADGLHPVPWYVTLLGGLAGLAVAVISSAFILAVMAEIMRRSP